MATLEDFSGMYALDETLQRNIEYMRHVVEDDRGIKLQNKIHTIRGA